SPHVHEPSGRWSQERGGAVVASTGPAIDRVGRTPRPPADEAGGRRTTGEGPAVAVGGAFVLPWAGASATTYARVALTSSATKMRASTRRRGGSCGTNGPRVTPASSRGGATWPRPRSGGRRCRLRRGGRA